LRIRVLGCHGGSAPGMHLTSFLVNDRTALDAGALTQVLCLEEQRRVSRVFLSHAHMDHICTLPFLLDNVLPDLSEPVLVYGPPETVQSLKRFLFNGALWPDFTAVSNEKTRVLRLVSLAPWEAVRVGDLDWTPVAMEHEVPCYGYLLQDAHASVFVSGDTVSLSFLPRVLSGAENLRAIFLEASFPGDEACVAERSMHLSAESFGQEVRTHVPPEVTVFVSHIKPRFAQEIRREVGRLALGNVRFLEQGKEYRF
jgi:ribonuclease BN (tRNA processing enzyme)